MIYIYDTLKKLVDNDSERKQPMDIYLDETDGKIKERPLSGMAASALNLNKVNQAKEIHKFIFGY